jgi:hypothetical protein
MLTLPVFLARGILSDSLVLGAFQGSVLGLERLECIEERL